MDFSKITSIQPNAAGSQEEVLTDTLETLNTLLEDTFVLFAGRDNFYQGLVFKAAFYDVNDNLCLSTNKSLTVLLNISNETITVQPVGQGPTSINLMPLKLLWMAFYIYLKAKGKTKYYKQCYSKSCVRHMYDDDMVNYSIAEKLATASLN